MIQTSEGAAPILGTVVVEGATYTVSRLPVEPAAARGGVVQNLAFEGKRGAIFFVTDYGDKYQPSSVAIGTNGRHQCAPRPIRGLRREHVAQFAALPWVVNGRTAYSLIAYSQNDTSLAAIVAGPWIRFAANEGDAIESFTLAVRREYPDAGDFYVRATLAAQEG